MSSHHPQEVPPSQFSMPVCAQMWPDARFILLLPTIWKCAGDFTEIKNGNHDFLNIRIAYMTNSAASLAFINDV